jgi:hypothetical protein
MISPIYYLEAKNRLRECKITVDMMGGENECQPMIVAQRDMLELETEYYREEAQKFAIRSLTVLFCCIIIAVLYLKGYINV